MTSLASLPGDAASGASRSQPLEHWERLKNKLTKNPNQESPELGLPWQLAAGFQPGTKPLWVGESRLARRGLPLLRLTLDTGGKGTDGARLPYLVAKQVWLAWASR